MLKKIIADIEHRDELPVEVSEIVDAIIAEGCEDIIFLKGVDADRSEVHGAFWKFVRHTGVYSDPQHVAIIPYNQNDPIEWQRVTCCKELMHLFDSDLERTDNAEEVPALIDRLLSRFSSDEVGKADLMASKDKLALYMCLPLLLPKAALLQARAAVASGAKTEEEIASAASMPLDLVRLMLDEEWDSLNGRVQSFIG